MCHCDGPEHPYDPSWCRPPRPLAWVQPIYIDPRYYRLYYR